MKLTTKNNSVLSIALTFALSVTCTAVFSQVTIDGKQYTSYKSTYFRPHRGLFYNIYVSPVLTVDPLGLGGKSTYALGAGTRIALWQSKSEQKKLDGLKIVGLYTGGGFEYYPQQYDKVFLSLWMRVKTFIPIIAKVDAIYSFDQQSRGTGTRYSFGVEIKSLTILLSGETKTFYSPKFGWHPATESDYANEGAISIIIPIYTRKEK